MANLFKRVLSPSLKFEPSSLYNKIYKEQMNYFDTAYKNQLREKPPKTLIVHPDTNFLYLRCIVPDKEMTPEQYFMCHVNGYSNVIFSTYPILNGAKFGKPIADATSAFIFKESAVFCLADGCGMGERPALSAKVACEAFSQYMSSELPKAKHLSHLEKLCVEAIAYAQTLILQSQDDPLDAGLTTFIGVVCVKTGTQFALVYVNVGDCQGLIIDPTQKHVDNLVDEEWRRTDMKSTGGRLGPVDGEYPELDNFKVGIKFCSDKSLVCLMSDGVADNFDVKNFFEKPSDCGCRGNEWHVSNLDHRNKRTDYQNEKILSLCDKESLDTTCLNLYKYMMDVTEPTRDAKVKNLKGFVQGKMDHSSFAVFQVSDSLFSAKSLIKKKLPLAEDLAV